MINILNNSIQTEIAKNLKIKGPSITTANACACSLSAIGEAFNLIKLGYADLMIIGSSEDM